MPMTHAQALEVLAEHRGRRLVITTMGSVGIWAQLSDTPLDFAYMPSAMGHAPGLGLGLALAQPQRGVIVVNGDGCTLMNLGALVTLADNPAPLTLVIIDNGMYEVTGGQPTPAAGRVDFAAIARGAGVERVFRFATVAEWRAGAAAALAEPGPTVIVLQVEGRLGQTTPKPPRSMPEQIERLRQALSEARAD
ncbi:MAG: thiamine pyrophosphate-dependent enzyme [Gemmataceae bacterium]|nr:thiamine pyrophosphate-dependent enzyme [Gemmataceae bacterium]MDW8264116.1 thiamine pyrophosphate-dependent enzyme [Gemmataceae bacterium]